MKSTILTILLACISLLVSAQDIIIFTNGNELEVTVIEITPDMVKYKLFNNLDGPLISELKTKVFKIKYENGIEQLFTIVDEVKQINPNIYLVDDKYRKPEQAFLFSFILPGVGQYYNGQVAKGIFMTFPYLVSTGLLIGGSDTFKSPEEFGILLILLSVGTFTWSIIDAPISAKTINRQNGYYNKKSISIKPFINKDNSFMALGANFSLNF